MSKGSPLTDPSEQARLMSRLADISRQRGENTSPLAPSPPVQQESSFGQNVMPSQLSVIALSIGIPPHVLARELIIPLMITVFLEMTPQQVQALLIQHQQQRLFAALNSAAPNMQYRLFNAISSKAQPVDAMMRASMQNPMQNLGRNSATTLIPSSVQRRTGVEEKPKTSSGEERTLPQEGLLAWSA